MDLFQSKPPAEQSGISNIGTAIGTAVRSALPGSTQPATASSGGWLMTVVGVAVIAVVGLLFWNWLRKTNGLPGVDISLDFLSTKSSGDKAPTPIDGKVRTVIPAGEVPAGPGSDYGVQYWMYISNWDYRFGEDKDVLKRISPTSSAVNSPRIYLGATDNTLHVTTSIFPLSTSAGAATPGAGTNGDSFTCSVENVPLQSWFSVSVTVFQRNLDVYINGRLVKSCVLPGVPKPAVGDIILNDNRGFAGSVCNVNYYGAMLRPEDARAFYAAGTNCAPPGDQAGKPVDKDSIFITLFGYTFRFSKLSKDGKELSSYTF